MGFYFMDKVSEFDISDGCKFRGHTKSTELYIFKLICYCGICGLPQRTSTGENKNLQVLQYIVFTEGCFLGWESVRLSKTFSKAFNSVNIAKKKLGAACQKTGQAIYIKVKYFACVCQLHFPSDQGLSSILTESCLLPSASRAASLLWHAKYFWWLLPQVWLPGLISFSRSLRFYENARNSSCLKRKRL